jgi:hypothetical protein
MAAKGIQLLEHPPNLPDLVLADFHLGPGEPKNALEEVARNITAGDSLLAVV